VVEKLRQLVVKDYPIMLKGTVLESDMWVCVLCTESEDGQSALPGLSALICRVRLRGGVQIS
jgi:hypothetical protein